MKKQILTLLAGMVLGMALLSGGYAAANTVLTATLSTQPIFVDGEQVNAKDVTEDSIYAVRRKVGMVFQNPDNQLVATTVEEDVAFGPENLGIPHGEMVERVDRALEIVKMTEYRIHAPHKLSGGQKQRVAIAGVLAMEPQCIIFDESTAMLDPLGRREVMDAILKLNREKGITVLLITHYMNEATEADRVFVLNEGSIFLSGTPEEVFSEVDRLQSVRLDAPQVTELCHLLMGKHENERLPLHTDEAAQAIAAYFGLKQ